MADLAIFVFRSNAHVWHNQIVVLSAVSSAGPDITILLSSLGIYGICFCQLGNKLEHKFFHIKAFCVVLQH